MAIQKQNIPINFAQGLDTKTDPKQVAHGKFLALSNTVFTKGGLLQKRYGFGAQPTLPDTTTTFATTFNGNLTAIGQRLRALSAGSASWVDRGALQPVQLNTLSLIRSNTPQTQVDAAIAPNGLVCTVYTDVISGSPVYKYAVADSNTGQNIVSPTALSVPGGTASGAPKVFLVNNKFIIVYPALISATNHLYFQGISAVTAALVGTPQNITSQFTPGSACAWDGAVANNLLYLAWNGSDIGGAIRMTYIDSALVQHNTVSFPTQSCTIMSVCADTTASTSVIYAAYANSTGPTSHILAVNQALVTVLAPTSLSAPALDNIACAAQNQVCTVFLDVHNTYSFTPNNQSNYIQSLTVTQAGSVSSATTITRGVGLASKAFIIGTQIFLLSAYSSSLQPTYFLLNGSGHVVAKLAYSNGYGYQTKGLPSVTVANSTAQLAYLKKDQIQAVNKSQGVTNAAGIYSQTGINLATFTFNTSAVTSAEIGANLNISGGFMWGYDGVTPTEQNFHLWPDNITAVPSASGGSMSLQQYYYQVTYEWADNQGNFFKSAPSVPVGALTASGTSSVVLNIPTLRLTYKIANPVKIVIYRWSTTQEEYFQVTSLTTPLLNDTTVDSITYTDTQADSAILGNELIYTTGGVVEDIAAPATEVVALFNSRLWLVDAEDPNLLWFSKQVIEATPVEMSDLLTYYVAPTTSAQGPTGPVTALAAMDDKLFVFKKDAIYYIAGTGPDNTGANSQYSDPIFVAGTVGCANPQSIVLTPKGLMFQSDKGIWLLGRDLSTSYIGAAVESLTQGATALAALAIPGTNQVRFTLDTGVTLMFDYYYEQWGSFTNIPALSSTLYNGLHTYINALGQVFQETPGAYLDGSSPTLISFTTGWLSFAGLQGFERAYEFYLLGTYLTPHRLSVSIAYDFNPSPSQITTITPDNLNNYYGDDPLYGSGSPYGGQGNVEQWRVFLQKQKCQAFQLTVQELFDSTKGRPAGAGLTISGIDLTVGVKSGRPKLSAARQVG